MTADGNTQTGAAAVRPAPVSPLLHLAIVREDGDAGYSAVVLNLPGAGSCGDTADEAVENAREATRGVLAAYGDAVPWRNTAGVAVPAGETVRWVRLDG